MSSRSNGVTNVLLTRRMIEWVVSSAACSASRIFWAISALERAVGQHLAEELGSDDEVIGGFAEQVVERAVDRAELQTHGELRTGDG